MKNFMAVYIGTVEATKKAQESGRITPETEQQGMAAWGQWMMKHQASIIDPGAPLGKTLRASPSGIATHHNSLTGYVIVRAESHEAAAEMFADHPHFSVFPGDSVEIIECLPMPGA